MKEEALSEIVQKAYQKADLLYEFVIKYNDMMVQPRDYGTGELLNMMEIHLLTHIDETPGITVSELAFMWNRTKGAISQQVKKLEDKGYIKKVKHETNGKIVLLYTTEEGQKLSNAHKHYDIVDIMQTMKLLMNKCTIEEIDVFYKVVGEYIKILQVN